MKLEFLVAPDFAPEHFGGWHMLSTALQTRTGVALRLVMPASAAEQAARVEQGTVDLIYANPFDASRLVREMGYVAIARPVGRSDEMVIASGAKTGLREVEDLRPGHRIALTDNRDVKLIGLKLLEPADLAEADLQWQVVESYQAAARLAIKGEVQAAFFLAEAFHSLSRLTRPQLHVLVESAIDDITHVVLAHPRIGTALDRVRDALCALGRQARDHDILEALGLPGGFSAMDEDEAELLLDIMETLKED